MEFREFRKVVVVVVAAEGRGEVDEKQRGEAQKGGERKSKGRHDSRVHNLAAQPPGKT